MVNWQTNDYYINLKDYEKETDLSVADQNRINNPYGNHAFGGLLVSQLLPQLLMGGAQKLGAKLEGSGNTGSETNIVDQKAPLIKLEEIKNKYQKSSDSNAITTYISELTTLKEKYPDNKKIIDALEQAKKTQQNGGRRTSQI